MSGSETRRAQAPSGDGEAALATRAAWLYHNGKLKQAEIARRLGLSLNKVSRLIAIAENNGTIRVLVEGPIAGCVTLEHDLVAALPLRTATVVPEVTVSHLPLDMLGRATATLLDGVIRTGRHRLLGIGHGRTLAAASSHLPDWRSSDVQIAALLGSCPRRISSYPFDLIQALTDRTGGVAHLLPVPFYAASRADRTVLLRQPGVRDALDRAAEATFHLFGIGSVAEKEATDLRMGLVTRDDLDEVRGAGAVAKLLGHYYDADGRMLDVSLHDRVIALDPERMRGREAVGVAGGVGKAAAILATLRTGLVSGLVTTEETARAVLRLAASASPPPRAASRRRR